MNNACSNTFWVLGETYDSYECKFTYFGTPCMKVWWQDLIRANKNYLHYEDANEETNGGLLVYFCLKRPKIAILAASSEQKPWFSSHFFNILKEVFSVSITKPPL